jgi:hypothetical protein
MPRASQLPIESPPSEWKAVGKQLLLLGVLMLAVHVLSGPAADWVLSTLPR